MERGSSSALDKICPVYVGCAEELIPGTIEDSRCARNSCRMRAAQLTVEEAEGSRVMQSRERFEFHAFPPRMTLRLSALGTSGSSLR